MKLKGLLRLVGSVQWNYLSLTFFSGRMVKYCTSAKKIPQTQILNKRNNLSTLNQVLFCVGDLFQESLYLIWFKITFMILQQISACICFLTGVYSSMGLSLQITIFNFYWKSEERCFGDMSQLPWNVSFDSASRHLRVI